MGLLLFDLGRQLRERARDLRAERIEPQRLGQRGLARVTAARAGEVEPEVPVGAILGDCGAQAAARARTIARPQLRLAELLPRLRRPRRPALRLTCVGRGLRIVPGRERVAARREGEVSAETD